MWLIHCVPFSGAESSAEFRGLRQFLTLFGHLQSRSDLTGWTCAAGLTIFGVSGIQFNFILTYFQSDLKAFMKPLFYLINYKSEINKTISYISSDYLFIAFCDLSGNSLSFLHGSRTFSAIESVPILRAFPKRDPLKALQWKLIMRPAKDWAPVTEPFPRASSSLDVQAGLHCAKRWVLHPFTASTTLIYLFCTLNTQAKGFVAGVGLWYTGTMGYPFI